MGIEIVTYQKRQLLVRRAQPGSVDVHHAHKRDHGLYQRWMRCLNSYGLTFLATTDVRPATTTGLTGFVALGSLGDGVAGSAPDACRDRGWAASRVRLASRRGPDAPAMCAQARRPIRQRLHIRAHEVLAHDARRSRPGRALHGDAEL